MADIQNWYVKCIRKLLRFQGGNEIMNHHRIWQRANRYSLALVIISLILFGLVTCSASQNLGNALRGTQALASAYTIPAFSATNLDDNASQWGIFYDGGTAKATKTNVSKPSVDGTALKASLLSGQPYVGIHVYRNLPPADAATSFELSLSLGVFVQEQERKTVSKPCTGIIRDHLDSVPVKSQRVLPDVVVGNAKNRSGCYHSCCDKPSQVHGRYRRPCNSGQQCESESGRVQEPFSHQQSNRHDPVRYRQQGNKKEQNAQGDGGPFPCEDCCHHDTGQNQRQSCPGIPVPGLQARDEALH